MVKKKVMMVFGTRPEAIKMAPLYHALRHNNERFLTLLCVTAQHRSMLDQVLSVFDIEPDIDLDIMVPGQDLFSLTASVLLGVRDVLHKHKPDALLVHGDTTTSVMSAMGAYYAGIPVGHVEAGLRTRDLYAPFPEEFNRQVTGRIAKWHFAPTQVSRRNLLEELVPDSSIYVTGNTVIDSLHWMLGRIEADDVRRSRVSQFLDSRLKFPWRSTKYVLVTGHRRENFGDGFVQICEALKQLALGYPEVHFVYPVHLNPNVQRPVHSILSGIGNMHLIDPLEYEPFVYLLKYSHIVLTDSGGIQEEAPSLGKPVLVMRDVTERPEAVSAGTVRLVGASKDKIVSNVMELLDSEDSYRSMAKASNPYGDGLACSRIVEVLGNS